MVVVLNAEQKSQSSPNYGKCPFKQAKILCLRFAWGVMTLGLFRTGPRIIIKDMVNWKSLKDKISDSELLDQHFTTSTKLHITRGHFDKLSDIIPNQKATDIMRVDEKKWNFRLPFSVNLEII